MSQGSLGGDAVYEAPSESSPPQSPGAFPSGGSKVTISTPATPGDSLRPYYSSDQKSAFSAITQEHRYSN